MEEEKEKGEQGRKSEREKGMKEARNQEKLCSLNKISEIL